MINIFIPYVCASIFAVIGRYYSNLFYKVFKCFPLIILISYLILTFQLNNITLFVILGLCFGLLGDLFLLNYDKYFKLGLISFLINHVCLSIYFLFKFKKLNIFALFIVFFLTVIYGNFMIKSLKKSLKYPVVIYMIIISLMIVLAFSVINLPMQVLIGVLLFAFSDSVLAYNKFIKKFNFAELLILPTYYMGQFLIGYYCLIFA